MLPFVDLFFHLFLAFIFKILLHQIEVEIFDWPFWSIMAYSRFQCLPYFPLFTSKCKTCLITLDSIWSPLGIIFKKHAFCHSPNLFSLLACVCPLFTIFSAFILSVVVVIIAYFIIIFISVPSLYVLLPKSTINLLCYLFYINIYVVCFW